MREFILNNDDIQSLKTSLLAFVKRVAFQGTQFEGEAGAFFPIVNLLLGIPVASDLNFDDLSEALDLQELECCGKCCADEPSCVIKWRRKLGIIRES